MIPTAVHGLIETFFRGSQRQFLENICWEGDLRSRISGNICCKISCLPASPRAEIFEKVSFDPYNFPITRLSARKSEQMKNL